MARQTPAAGRAGGPAARWDAVRAAVGTAAWIAPLTALAPAACLTFMAGALR